MIRKRCIKTRSGKTLSVWVDTPFMLQRLQFRSVLSSRFKTQGPPMMQSGCPDHDEISRVHATWLAAEIDGRIDALLDLCTDDVEMQPPIGYLVRGKTAVQEFLSANQVGIESIVISDFSIEIGHALAVKRARFSTKLAGQPQLIQGSHLWLLRPSWRVAFVTWSLDLLPD